MERFKALFEIKALDGSIRKQTYEFSTQDIGSARDTIQRHLVEMAVVAKKMKTGEVWHLIFLQGINSDQSVPTQKGDCHG